MKNRLNGSKLGLLGRIANPEAADRTPGHRQWKCPFRMKSAVFLKKLDRREKKFQGTY
jgi:hypothetical protein